jgi:hypothetical protein
MSDENDILQETAGKWRKLVYSPAQNLDELPLARPMMLAIPLTDVPQARYGELLIALKQKELRVERFSVPRADQQLWTIISGNIDNALLEKLGVSESTETVRAGSKQFLRDTTVADILRPTKDRWQRHFNNHTGEELRSIRIGIGGIPPENANEFIYALEAKDYGPVQSHPDYKNKFGSDVITVTDHIPSFIKRLKGLDKDSERYK